MLLKILKKTFFIWKKIVSDILYTSVKHNIVDGEWTLMVKGTKSNR